MNVHDFIRGPLVWISLLIFVGGFIYRTVRLFVLTNKRNAVFLQAAKPGKKTASGISTEEQKLDKIAKFQNSILGRHPVMTVVSTLFHAALFAAPLLLLAHHVLLDNAFNFTLPSIPEGFADLLTMVVIACGLFFLVRRIAIPKVAAISSGYDFVVLFITIIPFLTGFLAYHQLFDYKIIITLHILAGEFMLIALPFTKVGHMAFFLFSRLAMAGEYCLGRGSRTWST